MLLQVGGILLYIFNNVVQHTLYHEGELVVSGNVATWISNGNMKIFTFEEESINNHGSMEIFDGHFYGSSIQKNKILMLFYDYRELRVKSVFLDSDSEKKGN